MRSVSISLLVSLLVLSFALAGCSGSGASNIGPAQNPVPTFASVSPVSVIAGSAATTITVTGSGFVSSSTIHWNSTPLATTYASPTSLTALVPAAQLTAAGTELVTVLNPSPGGGTSASVNFIIDVAPNPVPVLNSISPSTATAGAGALTLTVNGANFVLSSTVEWNNSPLLTYYVNSNQLTALVPVVDLQSAGTDSVGVATSTPGGGHSGDVTFVVGSTSSQAVATVHILANDLAWDPLNKVIYLSLPSIDGANGNSVQALDPITGTLGAASFAGSEPNLLSVSQNSKYLYVSLDGSPDVQRMTLPSLGLDIEIPLGSDLYDGPFFAMDVQAAPNAAGTVAVVRGTPNFNPEEEGGVVIYDDGVARPNVLCGWIQSGCINSNSGLYDSIQWNPDATQLFAANTEDTAFDFYTIPVTPAGFGTPADYPGIISSAYDHIHFDAVTNYVYGDAGEIINPTTGSLVSTFAASGLVVPDGALGKAFFLGQTQTQLGGTSFTIESFDIRHFTPVAAVTIENVIGAPSHLIRWGTNGLAFTTFSEGSTTTGAVYLITGSFISGSLVDGSAATPPTENVKRTWKPKATHHAPALPSQLP